MGALFPFSLVAVSVGTSMSLDLCLGSNTTLIHFPTCFSTHNQSCYTFSELSEKLLLLARQWPLLRAQICRLIAPDVSAPARKYPLLNVWPQVDRDSSFECLSLDNPILSLFYLNVFSSLFQTSQNYLTNILY